MSRYHIKFIGDRYELVHGKDAQLGIFYQLIDHEFVDDPSGEGYILDIDEGFICTQNYTGMNPRENTFKSFEAMLFEFIEKEGLQLL